MRYSPAILDEIRARLSVSQVVGRKVALKRKGREFGGLSPFKTEKSPSFFVNDQKGFYHCFASGEHGDIFKFLMTTEGLSFSEAVERLADEAGVPLPKATARDAEREDQRTRLYALLESAADFFEQQLYGPAGAAARAYLEKRGVKPETTKKFRLGYGPNGKAVLKNHLAKAGFTTEEMVISGMLIGGEDIPVAYDRFRDRVMFPITDLKDRPIAFGGRAMQKDERAKYLNSPETPLFHKGGILFNGAKARPLAFERNQVIAVEGYMDVVALTEGGFGQSVAPLGTALTEDQVKLLWRMTPEPTLCFDGDAAGQKAAYRAVDTVLPHLKPGFSVSFVFLPDGLDPDDLIRQKGADAMRQCLAEAKPLSEVLFDREWAQSDWSTPERRARLESQLSALVGRIVDPGVRGHYGQTIAERLAKAWGHPPRLLTAPLPRAEPRAPAPSGPVPLRLVSSSTQPASTQMSGAQMSSAPSAAELHVPDWMDEHPGNSDAMQGYDDRSLDMDMADMVPNVPAPAPPTRQWTGNQQAGRAQFGASQFGAGKFGKPQPRPPGGTNHPGLTGKTGIKGGNGGGRFGKPGLPAWMMKPTASDSLRNSSLAGDSGSTSHGLGLPHREALMMRTLVNHPWLINDFAEDIAALVLTAKPLATLRDAMLEWAAIYEPDQSALAADKPLLVDGETGPTSHSTEVSCKSPENSLDRQALHSQLVSLNLQKVVDLIDRTITHRSDRFSLTPAGKNEVETGWRHALALHDRQLALEQALDAAEVDWHREGSEDAFARICEIKQLIASSHVTEPSNDP